MFIDQKAANRIPMAWQVYNTGRGSAFQNMDLDRNFLNELDPKGPCILRHYEWSSDSATHGYFINPFDYLNESIVKEGRLQLAKRPTGGGILFHIWDLTYSVLVPVSHPSFSTNTLLNYLFVHNIVSKAIYQFMGEAEPLELLPTEEKHEIKACNNFCMAQPSQYDVMLKGRKVGGGAQRRTKAGYLHQGTISLSMPSLDFVKDALQPNSPVLAAMQLNTESLLGANITPVQLTKARHELQALLTEQFLCVDN